MLNDLLYVKTYWILMHQSEMERRVIQNVLFACKTFSCILCTWIKQKRLQTKRLPVQA